MLLCHQSLGLGKTADVRGFTGYEDGSIGILKEGPGRLARKVRGIGFLIDDNIALRMEFGAESRERIRSASRACPRKQRMGPHLLPRLIGGQERWGRVCGG